MNSLKRIYSSSASIPNRIKLIDGDIFPSSFVLAIIFFVSCLTTGGTLEHLAPATQPRRRGGWPFLRGAHQTFWCPPQWRPSVLGTIDPRANFARVQTALPRAGARNHARVEQVVLFQVDLFAPSGVPAVLLPFFREDIHQFPLRVQAVSPYWRKTPRPMGS